MPPSPQRPSFFFGAPTALFGRFFACILAAAPAAAQAAAWTLPEEKWALYSTVSYYETERYFDQQRDKQEQLAFRKTSLNFYGEYGLRDDLTLGGSFFLDQVRGDDGIAAARRDNQALSDPSLFARWRLWSHESTVISVQPWIKLPSLHRTSGMPESGSERVDLEMRALFGHSFDWLERHHFVNLEAGFRHRLGRPDDQWLADATLGIGLGGGWTLMPQIFARWQVGGKPSTADPSSPFVQSDSNDYDLIKPQLALVYEFSPQWSLQAAAFRHIAGRNTGAGGGALLSLWYRP